MALLPSSGPLALGARRDVPGLGTLRPLDDLELHALALLQALALCSLDAGGVDEQILPSPVRGDEPVAPALAEPLDDPDRHALAPRPLPDPAASVRLHIRPPIEASRRIFVAHHDSEVLRHSRRAEAGCRREGRRSRSSLGVYVQTWTRQNLSEPGSLF